MMIVRARSSNCSAQSYDGCLHPHDYKMNKSSGHKNGATSKSQELKPLYFALNARKTPVCMKVLPDVLRIKPQSESERGFDNL